MATITFDRDGTIPSQIEVESKTDHTGNEASTQKFFQNYIQAPLQAPLQESLQESTFRQKTFQWLSFGATGYQLFAMFDPTKIATLVFSIRGAIELFPICTYIFLPKIDLDHYSDFKNNLTQIKKEAHFDYFVHFFDSDYDLQLHGNLLSFTSFAISMPKKWIASEPDVAEFLLAREFNYYQKLNGSHYLITKIVLNLIRALKLAFTSLGRNLGRLKDEAGCEIVGYEKGLKALKRYQILRRENNLSWKTGSIFSRFYAYFSVKKNGDDRINILTPSVENRIKHLEKKMKAQNLSLLKA